MISAVWRLFIAGVLASVEGVRLNLAPSPRVQSFFKVDEALSSEALSSEACEVGHPDVCDASRFAMDPALDWAVVEAVRERHPTKAPPPYAATQRRPLERPSGEMRWHYGSHHKTGTVLLTHLAIEHVKVMEEQACFLRAGNHSPMPQDCLEKHDSTAVWFWSPFTPQLMREVDRGQVDWSDPYHRRKRKTAHQPATQEPEREQQQNSLRGVHVIRDPLAMVVSGYVYHLKSNDVPSLASIRKMPMADGLAEVARYTVERSAKEMVEAYTSAPAWIMSVRFESFANSSESFAETTAAVYRHMLGDVYTRKQRKLLLKSASLHDLRRNASDNETGHASDPHLKEVANTVLDTLPRELLDSLLRMRRSLGY